MTPNHALEPTAASGLRAIAMPSSLRASAAARRMRYAAPIDPSPTRSAFAIGTTSRRKCPAAPKRAAIGGRTL